MSRITTENARAMAARSAESRRKNPLKACPPGFKLVPASYPEHVPADNSYTQIRLARVRGQLDLIDEMMRVEKDPQKLDRLASAQSRLAEQERILAGRPLPGSLRPRGMRPQRRLVDIQPDTEPAPEKIAPIPDLQPIFPDCDEV